MSVLFRKAKRETVFHTFSVLDAIKVFVTASKLRNSHRRCSVIKDVLRNFAKFTRKHLCQSLFFNKVADLRPATLLKKRLWYRCFPVNFAKLLRTPFSQNTSGRLLLKIKLLFIYNSEKTTPIYFQIV